MANVMLLGTAEAAAPTTVVDSQPLGLQLPCPPSLSSSAAPTHPHDGSALQEVALCKHRQRLGGFGHSHVGVSDAGPEQTVQLGQLMQLPQPAQLNTRWSALLPLLQKGGGNAEQRGSALH